MRQPSIHRLRVLFGRYEHMQATIMLEYPIAGKTRTVTIEYEKNKKKLLLRYDGREKCWQLYQPQRIQITETEQRFSKFRWVTLSPHFQHKIEECRNQLGKTMPITLTFNYYQWTAPLEMRA